MEKFFRSLHPFTEILAIDFVSIISTEDEGPSFSSKKTKNIATYAAQRAEEKCHLCNNFDV